MNEKEFLYYIMEQDGRTARIVNYVVQYLGNPAALPETPDGWQEIVIGWERNLNRYGNVRNFSLPLGFVLDGAQILRDGLYRSNIDRKLYLLIQRRVTEITDTKFRTYYKYLYKGELDFSTMEDDQAEPKVTIKIMEGGIQKLWDANTGTQYFIPFDEDARNVLMDGIEFDISALYLNPEVPDVGGSGAHGSERYALPISIINSEGTPTGTVFTSSTYETISGDPALYFPNSGNYFFYTAKAREIRIHGSIKANFGSTQSVYYYIVDNYNNYYFTSSGSQTGEQEITFDETIDLPDDCKLFIFCYDPLGDTIDYLDSDIRIEFKNIAPATTVKAFRPSDLYRKLCLKMGLTVLEQSSTLLSTCTYFLTSGDGLRGIAGAGIKTSMNDFFKAFNVYLMAGQAVQSNQLIFEARSSFFVTGNSTDLGPAKTFKIRPAKDLMFSSIKVGHREQNIDDVNGKYDFNGYQIYTSPVSRDTKELDLQSPYKAGPYEIEITRINLEGKTTTDGQNDNDVFVIDVNEAEQTQSVLVSFIASGNYLVFQDTPKIVAGQVLNITGSASNDRIYTVTSVDEFSTTQTVYTDQTIAVSEVAVTVQVEFVQGLVHTLRRDITVTEGVPSPSTIFNVGLSPKRLLLTHGPWLRGCLSGYEPGKMVFQSANRNADLIAGGITEDADVTISSLGSPMFKPWYFELDTQVPISLADTLETTPNKDFSGTWGEQEFEGFLIDAGLAPNTLQEQTFKLLAAPSTDMRNFINLPRNE